MENDEAVATTRNDTAQGIGIASEGANAVGESTRSIPDNLIK